MKIESTIRCEVTNETIVVGEGGFLSYSVVVNERGTFKRMNKGIRIGNSLVSELLNFMDAKKKNGKT